MHPFLQSKMVCAQHNPLLLDIWKHFHFTHNLICVLEVLFTMFFHHKSLKGEPQECYSWYLVVVTQPIHTLRPWHSVVCTVTGLNRIIMHFWNSSLWFKHPHAHKTAFNAWEWQQVSMCHNVVLQSYIWEDYLLTVIYSYLRLLKDTSIWLVLLITLPQAEQ